MHSEREREREREHRWSNNNEKRGSGGNEKASDLEKKQQRYFLIISHELGTNKTPLDPNTAVCFAMCGT